MLGEAVYEVFKDICRVYASDKDVNTPWLDKLDVSANKDVAKYLAKIKPNYIVHLAALTDMEYCELHPEEAYAVNTGGVQNMAEYARDHNIPLLYVSTAGIFDGKKEAYTESDIPNPLSVYGKSKYGGELVAKTLPKSIVIRAGWMMGGGPKKDKKFVNKIIKQIRAGSKELAVVTDKFGVPCHTYDLAQSVRYLLDHDLYGVYHGACEGSANRYDVAVAMISYLGLEDKIKVRQVNSNFFKEVWFAPRPRSEVLINTELKKIAPHLTRDWRICLKEYLDRFKWNLWDLNTSGMDRSFYKDYFKVEKEHWLMVVRRSIVRDSLAAYLTKRPEETRLLDFCCGSGIFIEELQREGFDTYGLDISAEAVRFGELNGIKNLDVIDSHKISFSDNTFDAVLSMDMLEHLENEDWALSEIERVLKPGGIAVVMVPAYMFLWGVQDKASHHYRRYTKGKLLDQIKKSTKFELMRSSYFNTFLFPAIAVVRLISRLFGFQGRESDYDLNSPFLNKIFFSIFNTERKALTYMNFPFGVSVLTVLKKK